MAAVLCWWKWEKGGIFKGVLGVFFFFGSVLFVLLVVWWLRFLG